MRAKHRALLWQGLVWLALAALASHTPVLHLIGGSLGWSMTSLWLSRLSPLACCVGLCYLFVALHLRPSRLALH